MRVYVSSYCWYCLSLSELHLAASLNKTPSCLSPNLNLMQIFPQSQFKSIEVFSMSHAEARCCALELIGQSVRWL